jgi:predicted CopG family antitoxin
MSYIRTTIKIREDLFQRLKKEVGNRGLSEAINRVLEEKFLKKKSLFGTMPKAETSDIRDHEDRV